MMHFWFCVAVPVIYYGMQHYLSLAGSLVLIPLIMVPAMGGTDVSILLCLARICISSFPKAKGNALMNSMSEINLFFHNAERYGKCDVHNAACVWHRNAAAFILWDSSSTGTRKLICIFGTSTSYYELPGVSQPYTTCRCYLPVLIHMLCPIDKLYIRF